MSAVAKVLKYELRDVARSNSVAVYAVLLVLLSEAFFRFSGVGPRALLSLVNVVLMWATDDPAADVNDDGIVDVQDLTAVITGWGEC